MEWVQMDRYTGLVATGATTDKVLNLAFPAGAGPKHESTAEAIAAIRAARDKAHGALAEVRVWGRGRPADSGDAPIDWNKMLAPPKPAPPVAEAPKTEPAKPVPPHGRP
jgi:hypothetical protein